MTNVEHSAAAPDTLPNAAFLAGGGEMGRLIRAYDWAATNGAATPLGPAPDWPQSLKMAVRIMLTTRHPMFIFWGAQHVCLYNDGYRASLGPEKHPAMLGTRAQDAWPEIWPIIGPQIEFVRRGDGATWDENSLVPILRNGAIRDVYWTYSFAPIDDPAAPNGIGGVLVICTETTDQVLAEQRRLAGAERVRVMLAQTPGFVVVLHGPDHVFNLTNAAFLQLVDRDELVGRPLREAFPELAGQAFPGMLDQVYVSGETFTAKRLTVALQRTPGAAWQERMLDLVCQPIRDADGSVTGIFCQGMDMTDTYGVEAALRATQARQALLLALLQGQRETTDPEAMMQAASEAVARHLRTNRAGFLQVDHAVGFVVIACWSDGALPEFAPTLPVGLIGPTYLAEVRRGRTVAVADNTRDPLTRDSSLAGVGFRASIGSPIVRAGVWRANMFVHDADVRHWHEEDIALVRDVANQTWDAVERAGAVIALQDSESFTRLLLNSTSEAFYAVDVKGTTTMCNDAFLTMLGFKSKEEVIGRKLHTLIHHSHADGSHYPGAECPIYHAASRGQPAHVSDEVFFRRDGTSFAVEYRAAPIRQHGQVQGAICTFVDITERQQAETALRHLNETLEARVAERTAERDRLWQTSQDMLAVIDTKGAFRAVNPAATAILGWTQDEMVGRMVFDFVLPDDLASTAAALAHATERALPVFLNRFLHKDGGFRWMSWLATPEGELIYASGRHVSAQMEAEAQLAATQQALRQSQKMDAVGQLTGGIAHDFNNMLAVVIGSLDLLGRRMGTTDTRTRRYVDAAMDGARRAALLTQRLLAFSRQQPLRPEQVDPNALVGGMSELLGRALGSDIRLEVRLAPSAWWIEVDVNQLENVILNLAVNARDAMPNGGDLTIQTRNASIEPLGTAAHSGVPAGAFVLLTVTDTGSGMPADVLARAFDPFYTTKDVGKGTGLGLSQVYGFVNQSGGHVRLVSEVGIGTTVSIYLPRMQGERHVVDTASQAAALVRQDRQEVVLVVDDEPTVRQFSIDALTELGYQVLAADGAGAALRLLDAHADIALLFTDVVMPETNGGKLAEQAQQLRPALKVLFTTGYPREAVVQNGALDPAVPLLGKPFTIEQLSAKVRMVLDASAPSLIG